MTMLEMIVNWATQNDTPCTECSHPSGTCSGTGDCQTCLNEIHWGPSQGGRTDYDCKKLLRCYVQCYSERYFQNIKHACEGIDFSLYPQFDMLSIGCGTSPDLMAFTELAANKPITYKGIDRNTLWGDLQTIIAQYTQTHPMVSATFEQRDIFTATEQTNTTIYNIVVMQFLISSILNNGGNGTQIDSLFNNIVSTALLKWKQSISTSPFLFILNDVDSMNKGRNHFHKLIDLLERNGYKGKAFAYSAHSSGDLGTERWSARCNFSDFGNITYRASACTSNNSATLTIEVSK
jgi:hypothetical protein